MALDQAMKGLAQEAANSGVQGAYRGKWFGGCARIAREIHDRHQQTILFIEHPRMFLRVRDTFISIYPYQG